MPPLGPQPRIVMASFHIHQGAMGKLWENIQQQQLRVVRRLVCVE